MNNASKISKSTLLQLRLEKISTYFFLFLCVQYKNKEKSGVFLLYFFTFYEYILTITDIAKLY